MDKKYICQLPSEVNLEIYILLKDALYQEGYRNRELFDIVESKMSGSLRDLEGIIDVSRVVRQ